MNSININGWTENNKVLKAAICRHNNPVFICVTETHLSGKNEICSPGYKWYGNNRKLKKKNAAKTYGGVGILVRDDIFKDYLISVCACDYDGLLAINIVCKATEFSTVLACTYLAPSDSPYGADPEGYFNRLMLLIYECQDSENIFMCGDINARIGNRKDIIMSVDNVSERLTVDTAVNSHGKSFLEFLNDACCCVVNGRKGHAKNTYVSTKGSSEIDFVYVPYDVIDKHFEILSCA